jgi:hypothetical protein
MLSWPLANVAVQVTDAARRRLLRPMEFPMTGPGLGRVIASFHKS